MIHRRLSFGSICLPGGPSANEQRPLKLVNSLLEYGYVEGGRA